MVGYSKNLLILKMISPDRIRNNLAIIGVLFRCCQIWLSVEQVVVMEQ